MRARVVRAIGSDDICYSHAPTAAGSNGSPRVGQRDTPISALASRVGACFDQLGGSLPRLAPFIGARRQRYLRLELLVAGGVSAVVMVVEGGDAALAI